MSFIAIDTVELEKDIKIVLKAHSIPEEFYALQLTKVLEQILSEKSIVSTEGQRSENIKYTTSIKMEFI
ncbi:MAG TPA: hypothetical protein DCM73_04405 [Clostridiales bacterium]|nr:hypothetical protein [Clostridiales bacterium]